MEVVKYPRASPLFFFFGMAPRASAATPWERQVCAGAADAELRPKSSCCWGGRAPPRPFRPEMDPRFRGGVHSGIVVGMAAHLRDAYNGVVAHVRHAVVPPPSCNACHPPVGEEHYASGCDGRASAQDQEVPADATRRVVVHVATCQEDLSWIKCSWHANISIRVVHKCTREYPGYLRNRTTNRLQQQPWRGLARPRLPCMVHLDSAHPRAGRESEAYLSEIAATYEEIRDDDTHVFIQGSQSELSRFNLTMEGLMPRLVARRDLGFASLTGSVEQAYKDLGPHYKCGNHIVREGIRLGALRWLRCDAERRFAGSMRGVFAVSGRRIRQTPHATWTAYHQTMVDAYIGREFDTMGEHYESLETVWPLLFGCCSYLGSYPPSQTNVFAGWRAPKTHAGFECYEGAPAQRPPTPDVVVELDRLSVLVVAALLAICWYRRRRAMWHRLPVESALRPAAAPDAAEDQDERGDQGIQGPARVQPRGMRASEYDTVTRHDDA